MSISCIYRKHNSCCLCNFNAKIDKYCGIHSNNYNVIYEIIDNAIGRNEININELYNIFKYIYNNDKIYTKEFMFKACLKTLYSNLYYLRDMFKNYIEYDETTKNDNLIHKIFLLNLRTYNIEKNNYNNFKIIYRCFINKIIKKHKYHPDIILNNDEDPFTLDNIKELDKNELFIYSDKETNYFFIATELKYFIDTNGSWNPYTKQEITESTIRNLNYFIKYFKLNKKNTLNKYEWNSIHQAFTDVSQIIEKIGFYNDTKWLLKLTSKQIKNIIKTFKLVSRDYQDIQNYFINITDNNIFYDFARETIKLFENGNDNFILCCNFIKSISLYSDDFYNNIPEWMVDIETPNIITIPIPINTRASIINEETITNNINNLFNSVDILYFINIMNNE
jgi:virulence-associated protein VapD